MRVARWRCACCGRGTRSLRSLRSLRLTLRDSIGRTLGFGDSSPEALRELAQGSGGFLALSENVAREELRVSARRGTLHVRLDDLTTPTPLPIGEHRIRVGHFDVGVDATLRVAPERLCVYVGGSLWREFRTTCIVDVDVHGVLRRLLFLRLAKRAFPWALGVETRDVSGATGVWIACDADLAIPTAPLCGRADIRVLVREVGRGARLFVLEVRRRSLFSIAASLVAALLGLLALLVPLWFLAALASLTWGSRL
jgi:hypothetical protein